MKACGAGQVGGRNCRYKVVGCALTLRFEDGLRHLLDEQGDAVSAIDDVLPDVRWEEFVAADAIDYGSDVALSQPIDCEGGYMRPSDPGWLEFRPERHEQKHAIACNPVHRPTECLQARGVGPVHILDDHQHWIGARQDFQLSVERL